MATSSTSPEFSRETGGDGSWKRQRSAFRDTVTADGSSGFPAAPGRYHLYVSLACPWAHRAIIVRMLKGLEEAIPMTVVDPIRDERGWRFGRGDQQTGEPDPLHGWTYLSEAYDASDDSFEGRITVPTLWDTETGHIVNNESADVMRMIGSAWDEWAGDPALDLYPEELREEIDAVNEWVYPMINDGVYRCGFAAMQEAYEEAYHRLFEGLDRAESILASQRWLAGDGSRRTEADWRLFTTLVRFDPVYVRHFRANKRRIVDYPALWDYARELYQVPGVAATVDFDHIKRHYFQTHDTLNPTRIVPLGPDVDFEEPHTRGS